MVYFPEISRYAYLDDFDDLHADGPLEFYFTKTFKEARNKCLWHIDRLENLGIKIPEIQVVGVNSTGHPIFIEDIT